MQRNHLSLGIVCLILLLGGCKCQDCLDYRPALIDRYVFTSVIDAAGGYNHCDYEHVIGISPGGGPCAIGIVGLDGWGILDSASVVVGEVTGPESFDIVGGTILGRPGPACSQWRNIRARGSGVVNANILDIRVEFSDTAGNYSSGMMRLNYQRQ